MSGTKQRKPKRKQGRPRMVQCFKCGSTDIATYDKVLYSGYSNTYRIVKRSYCRECNKKRSAAYYQKIVHAKEQGF